MSLSLAQKPTDILFRSIAAGIQGPAVAAGCVFAFCQSAAAGGYAAAAVASAGQAGFGAVFALFGGIDGRYGDDDVDPETPAPRP